MDPEGCELASLQTLLDTVPDGGASAVALFGGLRSETCFHRDTGFGRTFHPGRAWCRENRAANHVSAHVDLVSPLRVGPPGPPRRAHYSLRFLGGRQGDHRSHLDCGWMWEWLADPATGAPDLDDLLDREASSWSVQVEAQVSGTLDELRLRDALDAVLGDQPFDHDPLRVVGCPDQAAEDATRRQLQRQPAGWDPSGRRYGPRWPGTHRAATC